MERTVASQLTVLQTMVILLLLPGASISQCTDPAGVLGDVQIVGGGYYGRVEYCDGTEWGVVCDNQFDEDDAMVICRQLGLLGPAQVRDQNLIQDPSMQTVVLGGLQCTGAEERLNLCPTSPSGTNPCNNNRRLAGVECLTEIDPCSFCGENEVPVSNDPVTTIGPQSPAETLCECAPGYMGQAGSSDNPCTDINECDDEPCTNARCENTEGSFECVCNDGFVASVNNPTVCEDINECDCAPCTNAQCENTDGSFECICNDGFVASENDATVCEDIDECDDDPCTNAQCDNTDGSFECICNDGFIASEDDATICEDINECEQIPRVCPRKSLCTNIVGSFTCECRSGFIEKHGCCIRETRRRKTKTTKSSTTKTKSSTSSKRSSKSSKRSSKSSTTRSSTN